MEKLTIIDQITITRGGTLQVRMVKVLVDDDGVVHNLGNHRTSIEPGVGVDFVLGEVNRHLGEMQMGAVPEDETPTLRSLVALLHTPAKVAEFRAERAAAVERASRQ